MALELELTKDSISSNCLTLTVSDTTGDYNATTNPTGYGAPNETRANLYLKFFVTLRKSTGRESITVSGYNENTVTSWAVTIAEDGWYELYLFACKAWSSGTTYQLNYIAYDASTDAYYKSIQGTNLNHAVSDAAWWTVTADIDDFIAAINATQPNTYNVTKNIVELCQSRKCEGQMLLKAGCDCCDDCFLKEYEKVRMKVESAGWAEALGSFTEAQEIVESLNEICANQIDCGCK